MNQMIADIEDIIFPIDFVIIICSIIERPNPNACDAVRNFNACKAFTIIERPLANACDAIADSDAC